MYNTGRSGHRGAVTPAQLSRLKGRDYSNATAGDSIQIKTFFVETTDYVTDGSLYKVELEHEIGRPYYTWSAIKADNNAGVIIEYFHHGDLTLTLWLASNTLELYVTVIG